LVAVKSDWQKGQNFLQKATEFSFPVIFPVTGEPTDRLSYPISPLFLIEWTD
jgi:hypothetical protein